MSEAATGAWPQAEQAATAEQAAGQGAEEERDLNHVTADRKAYWQGWYADNRERIAAKRSRKWHEDPAYREACNAARRRQRRTKAAQQRRERPVARPAPPPQMAVVGGVAQLVYTLRDWADRLGISQGLLRQWRLYGQIPASPLRGPGGRHLYTGPMLDAADAIIRQRARTWAGKVSLGGDTAVGVAIAAAWNELLREKG